MKNHTGCMVHGHNVAYQNIQGPSYFEGTSGWAHHVRAVFLSRPANKEPDQLINEWLDDGGRRESLAKARKTAEEAHADVAARGAILEPFIPKFLPDQAKQAEDCRVEIRDLNVEIAQLTNEIIIILKR